MRLIDLLNDAIGDKHAWEYESLWAFGCVEGLLMNYLTSEEAANSIGCSTSKIRHDAVNNKIPGAKKPGRDWLIPASWVEEERIKSSEGRGRPLQGFKKC